MQIDKYTHVRKEWFESLTKKEQIDFIRSRPHILTKAEATKLHKNIK